MSDHFSNKGEYVTTFEQQGIHTYGRSLNMAISAYNGYQYIIAMDNSYFDYKLLEANHDTFFRKVAFDTEPGAFHKLPEQVKVFFQQCMEDRQHEEADPLDSTIHRCYYCGVISTYKLPYGHYVCKRHRTLYICEQCGKTYPNQWFGELREQHTNKIHIGCQLENSNSKQPDDNNFYDVVPHDGIKYNELRKAVMVFNEKNVPEKRINYVCVKGPILYDTFINVISDLSDEEQLELPDDVIDFFNHALGAEDETEKDTNEYEEIKGQTATDLKTSFVSTEKMVTEEALVKTTMPARQVVKFEDEPSILKQLLVNNAISQKEAARAINITQPQLSAKLNNKKPASVGVRLALYKFIKGKVSAIPYKIERFEKDSFIESDNLDAEKSNDELCRCKQCDCLVPYKQYKNNKGMCTICVKEAKEQTPLKRWDGSYMSMFEQAGAPYYFKTLNEAWKALENIKGRKHSSKYLRKMISTQYGCQAKDSQVMRSAILIYSIIYDIPSGVSIPEVMHNFFIMYMLDRIQEEVDPFNIAIKRCKYCGMPATTNTNKTERTCDAHKDVRTCTNCKTRYVPRWGGAYTFCPTCDHKFKINNDLLTVGFNVVADGKQYYLYSKHPNIQDSASFDNKEHVEELLRSSMRKYVIDKLNRVVSYEKPKELESEEKPNKDLFAACAQATEELIYAITEMKPHSETSPVGELFTDNTNPVVCTENTPLVAQSTSPEDIIKLFTNTVKDAAKGYILNSMEMDDKPHRIMRILALQMWQELEATELELEKEVGDVAQIEVYNKDSVNFYTKELSLSKNGAIGLVAADTLAATNDYLRQ